MTAKKWLLAALAAAGAVAALLLCPPDRRLMATVVLLLAGAAGILIWSWLSAGPINVKDVTAGHGQHGKSRWMNDTEKSGIFLFVFRNQISHFRIVFPKDFLVSFSNAAFISASVLISFTELIRLPR